MSRYPLHCFVGYPQGNRIRWLSRRSGSVAGPEPVENLPGRVVPSVRDALMAVTRAQAADRLRERAGSEEKGDRDESGG